MPGVSRVLIALMALAVPVTVAAQPATEEVPRPPGWVLTPTMGLGGSWNNNVLLVSEGDTPIEDYGTPVDTSVNLDYRGRRLNLTGSYGGSFVMYRTYTDVNSSNQSARFHMDYRASPRLMIFAQEQFVDAPSTDALNLAGVPFYRTGSQTNELGGGIEALLDRHTTLAAGYTLRAVAFDAQPGQLLQDGHEHQWSVAVTRAHTSRLTIGAHYDIRHEVLSNPDDRFNIQQAGATAEYTLSPRFTVSGMVGVAVLGDGVTQDGSVGPAILAQLRYQRRATSVSASYQRTFVPSFGFGGTFQNEEWVGSVHLPIGSSRVYVDSTVAWFDNDPIVSGQPSLQSLWVTAAGGYRASPWLSVEVYGSRVGQDTQRAGGNVRQNVLGFRVVVSKPMRVRRSVV